MPSLLGMPCDSNTVAINVSNFKSAFTCKRQLFQVSCEENTDSRFGGQSDQRSMFLASVALLNASVNKYSFMCCSTHLCAVVCYCRYLVFQPLQKSHSCFPELLPGVIPLTCVANVRGRFEIDQEGYESWSSKDSFCSTSFDFHWRKRVMQLYKAN